MAAVVLLIGLVVHLATVAAQNSPEGKLKAAQEQAEMLAETADQAAESYERLNDALDDLSSKYDALDELTRGTKEWNEAVQEINSSVLDLIDEYPELASAVSSDNGVLKLDQEKADAVLAEAYAKKVTTQNAAILAKAEVSKAENVVAYDKLDDSLRFGYQDATAAGW